MAKGDDKRARNRIDYEGGLAQNWLTNMRKEFIPQNQQMWNQFIGQAIPRALEGYDQTMGGFQDFAKTGGFSPEDIANIRSRAMAAPRSIYSGLKRDINRQSALQGYAPNKIAALSKIGRDASQSVSDARTNANAAIAQLVQQGKLGGLQGAGSLYGTAPGMAGQFGNQFLNSQGQRIQMQGLQNQLGLGLIGAQIQAGGLPGDWEHGFGRVKDVAGAGAGVLGAFKGK